ncbi:hypothetical protein [Zobellia roscoffensis]|uniref:hypothetical protein n=1 Tax=Zobellia roscoffensis TaxID=2779508 RepID=UPI00188C5DEA|nr:hypothetical protein [Zobellia roscoffensis]
MEYFFLEKCLDEKIAGTLPQQKKLIVKDVNSPDFLDNLRNKCITAHYELPVCEIFKKANFTDLIDAGGLGFTDSLLITDSLKRIIEEFNYYGIQFFKTKVIKSGLINNSYWHTHVHDVAMTSINYKKSTITESGRGKDRQVYSEKVNADNFLEFKTKDEQLVYPHFLTIDRVEIKAENIFDFFAIDYTDGGLKYVISNNLKKVIVDRGVSGLEFRPLSISYVDWVSKGGMREKVYGKAY